MKHNQAVEYPIDTVTDMVRFYKQGVTIEELSRKYQRLEANIKAEISKFTTLHGRDSINENYALIQMAESRLCQLAEELRHNGSVTGTQIYKYRALLFWYTKADLNEGVVFIPKELLK